MTLIRALAASVKLPSRVPQSRPGLSGLGGGNLLSTGATAGMAAYREVGAAHGPIRRLCQSVALTNWSLYQQTQTSGSTDRQLLDDATAPARYPGTALWVRPNPFMTRRQFLFLHQLWKTTAGGVYWLIVKAEGPSPYPQRGMTAPIELWPIRRDRITPVPDAEAYVSGYVYTLGTEKIPLDVSTVIPIGWPDPLNPLDFTGPLQSIMPDLESERYAAEYQRNLFLNGARPGGVIEFDAPLPQDRFDEIVLRWREQHQGVSNAARVAVIEQGKWVDVAQHNTDLQYEALRHLDREAVMFATGVPYATMQSNDVNLANAQMADKQFFRWTLRPELEDVKEALNERVLPLLGDNLTMDYELPTPEDEAFDVFSSTSGFLSGVLRLNEARAGMGYDADDSSDADQYIWQITGTPPPMARPRPPRAPTGLSYQPRTKAFTEEQQAQADAIQATWAKRLEQVRQQYLDLLASRN